MCHAVVPAGVVAPVHVIGNSFNGCLPGRRLLREDKPEGEAAGIVHRGSFLDDIKAGCIGDRDLNEGALAVAGITRRVLGVNCDHVAGFRSRGAHGIVGRETRRFVLPGGAASGGSHNEKNSSCRYQGRPLASPGEPFGTKTHALIIDRACGKRSLVRRDFSNTFLAGRDTAEEIRTNVETNFLGPLFLTRAFAPVLSAQDESVIIDIHSAMSWYAVGGIYSATKAALCTNV